MRYFRKGGIRFLKLGRFGFSFWWSKRKRTVNLGPEAMWS